MSEKDTVSKVRAELDEMDALLRDVGKRRMASLEMQKNRPSLSSYQVNEYQLLGGDGLDGKSYKLRRMPQAAGPDKWAVYLQHSSVVLNKQGEKEWEPSPSNRDEEFMQRCRFDTPEEALEFYQDWIVNGERPF